MSKHSRDWHYGYRLGSLGIPFSQVPANESIRAGWAAATVNILNAALGSSIPPRQRRAGKRRSK